MVMLYVLLLLCQVTSAAKHSLKYFVTATSGVPNIPEFVGLAVVDDVLCGYCDTTIKTGEPKEDWVKKLLKDNPQHLEWYSLECLRNQHVFRADINSLKQRLNHTEGVHILQRMNGCEWDDETGDITGFSQYGYDGEDFIALDLKTLTWTAPKPQAFITKLKWDAEKARLEKIKNFHIYKCPDWLKMYLHYGKRYLQKTVPPSVSLLQKSPSSPVSCHATGFYPDRATMFWRKDGEDLHEDVEYEEILPNHDGTFQMRVDLNISSVKPEDWRRYDCVFHVSDFKEDLVTKLDKAIIRTNWGKTGVRHNKDKSSQMTIVIITIVSVVAAIIFSVVGLIVYEKKKAKRPQPRSEKGSELSEKLNPKT